MRPDDRTTDERRLASGALRALGMLTPPVVAVAAVGAGWAGSAGAAAGLALVAVLFGGSAALLGWVGRRRPSRATGILLGGALGRLLFYVLALTALAQLDSLHRPSLAIATATAIGVTLAYELRLMSRMPRLFWVDARAGHPDAVPPATRSQSL